MPELLFGPILVYVAIMVTTCAGLAVWHQLNWRRSGRRSAILRTESRAAAVDGLITAGSGGALVAVPLLRGTALAAMIPVADAVVVLAMSVIIVREPVRMLRSALREAAGGASEATVVDDVRHLTREHLRKRPFALLEVAMTRMGRNSFVVVYLRPNGAVEASALDSLRQELHQVHSTRVGPVKTEVIVTETPPFDRG